jgi:hypothetical protein
MIRHVVGKDLQILIRKGNRLVPLIIQTSNGKSTRINQVLYKMFKMLAMFDIMSILSMKMVISIRFMTRK